MLQYKQTLAQHLKQAGRTKTCHGKVHLFSPLENCYGNPGENGHRYRRPRVRGIHVYSITRWTTQQSWLKNVIGRFTFSIGSPGFHSTKTDMYRWWADQPDWRTKGNILARLRHMFDNLEASAAAAKQQDALLMDPEVDNPIDKKTHDSLTRFWLSLYGCRLHPTQEGTHQVLGSM